MHGCPGIGGFSRTLTLVWLGHECSANGMLPNIGNRTFSKMKAMFCMSARRKLHFCRIIGCS